MPYIIHRNGNGASRCINPMERFTPMANIALDKNIRAAIATDVAAVERSAKARHMLIDLMVASGLRWTDFISPKAKDSGSTATPELFSELKEAVVAGFTAADQSLIKIESKAAVAALKPEKAARRTYLQQQIGSRMKDYKNALKRRQDTSDDKGGAGGGKRPAADRLLDHLSKAINVLRQESDFAFEVAPMIERLTKEVTLIKQAK